MPEKKRILIVDDHPIVREGLVLLLSRQPDFEICGEADDVPSGLKLALETRPDVVTVDLSLKDGNGLDLVKRLANFDIPPAMIVCSLHDEILYAERALQAGAQGYINKLEATRTIVGAIRQVLDGKTYLSDRMTALIAERMVGGRSASKATGVAALSDRELQVFTLIGQGKSTLEIAQLLHIGGKTVDTHRRRIKAKLHLATNPQLTCEAAQWVAENIVG
jgi:DNA-binding NarL/FixJ family response regulator